jgi:putative two-component system response regulator
MALGGSTFGSMQDRLDMAHGQLLAYAKDLREIMDFDPGLAQDMETYGRSYAAHLLRICEMRCQVSAAHMKRVGKYAYILASALGLAETDLTLLRLATPLHDLGKIGIPETLLLKNGSLNPDEWELLKQHPVIGAYLLSDSTSVLLTMAREIILTHHEHWDGSGYPHGLTGRKIPLSGRIARLATVYDALRCERPYKEPVNHGKACRIILSGDYKTKPEHFDPVVLDAFREQHGFFAEIFEEHPEPTQEERAAHGVVRPAVA